MHINFSELLVILLVAVLVIKPENLPKTLQNFSKGLQWFKKTTQQIKDEIEKPIETKAKE